MIVSLTKVAEFCESNKDAQALGVLEGSSKGSKYLPSLVVRHALDDLEERTAQKRSNQPSSALLHFRRGRKVRPS